MAATLHALALAPRPGTGAPSDIECELLKVGRYLLKPYSPQELARLYPLDNVVSALGRSASVAAMPRLFNYAGRYYGLSEKPGTFEVEVFYLLRIKEVMPRVGMSRNQVNEAVKNGTFPLPYLGIGASPRVWRENDIQQFVYGNFKFEKRSVPAGEH